MTAWNQAIRIEIRDKEFSSPIAYGMIINDLKTNGGTTDINGQINLSIKKNECWHFEAFGYASAKQCWNGQNPWIIYLETSQIQMNELVISVKEDPAYSVMRKCIANAPINDPLQSQSFKYQQYSKLIIDFIKGKNQKIDSVFTDKHLFLMETASIRRHAPPKYDHEEIIANKMSGFQIPQSTIIGTQLQSFSVYEPDFQIFENVYLSPAGPRAEDRYEYKMMDTLFTENQDSIFVISFYPKKRFLPNGMKGNIHVHSSHYAVCRIMAEPAEPNVDLYVKIQQNFESVQQVFFPTQINAFFELPNMQNPLTGEIQTQINQVSLEKYSFRDFDNISLTYEEKANFKDSSEWGEIRQAPLSTEEIKTYLFLDSLGKSQNLEKKTQFLTALTRGNIQWGNIEIPIQRLFRYNGYEGYRWGLGVRYQQKGVQPLSYEGYFAYGNKDKAFKWGGSALWEFKPDVSGVRVQYFRDVKESGQQLFPFYRPDINQSVYELFATRMDMVQGGNISTFFPIYQSLAADICYQNVNKKPHQDIRYYSDFSVAKEINQYQLEEFKLVLRWAPGERRVNILQHQYLLTGYWPVIKMGYTQSYWKLSNNTISNSFSRYHIEAEKIFKSPYWGDFKIFTELGKLIGNAPLTEIHAAKGTISPARKISISVPQTFETLPNSQWYAREYVHVFLRYKSNITLYRTASSAPFITAIFNAGWGRLGLNDQYSSIICKEYPLGLYETGLQIDNFLKSSTSGIGVGAYYRFGPYHDSIEKNNWMIKLTSTVLF